MGNKTIPTAGDRQQRRCTYDAMTYVQERASERMERVNRILRESRNAVAAKRAADQRR